MWKGERERESGITFSISGRAELSSDLSRCHSCWLSNLFGTEAFSPRFTSFPIPLYGESRERNNKAASLSDIALMHALPALSILLSIYIYTYILSSFFKFTGWIVEDYLFEYVHPRLGYYFLLISLLECKGSAVCLQLEYLKRERKKSLFLNNAEF